MATRPGPDLRAARRDRDDPRDDEPDRELPDDEWPAGPRRDVRAGVRADLRADRGGRRVEPTASRRADALAAVAARCGVTPRAVLGVIVLAIVVVATLGVRAVLVQRQSVAQPVVPASSLVGGGATGATATASASTAGSLPGAVPGAVPAAAGSVPATAAATVVVDVVGQVRRPGVVELPVGSRVHQAVAAAGGALGGSDLAQVNLARVVVDGEQVVVPGKGQTLPAAAAGTAPSAAGGGATGGAVVDLNSATASDLDALPGVGPVLAQRILDWRTANGRFSSVDELSEVSGIGDAVLTGLRSRVRV